MNESPATPDEGSPQVGDPVAASDPDEEMKAKYRAAMAQKHGASGTTKELHGDTGAAPHAQTKGPTQRMFRRKAGG